MIEIDNQNAQAAAIDRCLSEIAARATASDSVDVAPAAEIESLASAGLLKITLPGEPLDFNLGNTSKLLELLKRVGKANLSIGRIYEGHINALYLIHLFANPAQKEYWYRKAAQDSLFAVWNTQADNGIKLCQEGEKIKVSGKKTFCSGAAIVTTGLITGEIATEDRQGWQMMLVEMDQIHEDHIDKSSWKTLGMRASGSFTVDFSGYTIQEHGLLGQPGEYLKQPYFNGGAIRFAAVQLGGVEAIAAETITYLKLLNRTDNELQNVRIANIMTGVSSGNLWINRAGINFDLWANLPEKAEDLIAFANMTRTAIEEIGVLVMKNSNECVGARGLMQPFVLERLYRDLSFYLRQPAPDATKLAIASFFFRQNHEGKPF